MSTVLSSRIVTSRSPTSTEVAHDEDVVVALIVEPVADELVVEAVIDDDHSQGVRVAVAKGITAKPVPTKAKRAQSEPIACPSSQSVEVDESAPRTIPGDSVKNSAPAMGEQPTARDIAGNRPSEVRSNSRRPPTSAVPDAPTSLPEDKTGDDSVPAKSEIKAPNQTKETVAYSIERSVGLAPLTNEDERPSPPAAADQRAEQPQQTIEVPKPSARSAKAKPSINGLLTGSDT